MASMVERAPWRLLRAVSVYFGLFQRQVTGAARLPIITQAGRATRPVFQAKQPSAHPPSASSYTFKSIRLSPRIPS